MSRTDEKRLLGWREWASLPDLGIPAIKVKIDTGARSSAIQAEEIEIFRQDGVQRVRFIVRPLPRKKSVVHRVEADLLDVRIVRSSNGVPQERPTVRTSVRIGDVEWPIELTLAERADMRFRMLLGRSAMRGRFTVDPELSYQLGRRPT